MAVIGIVIGGLLDRTGWLADEPLTGNVVAGILGAPATVLLALLIFDRLASRQRHDDWVRQRREVLQTALVPQLDSVVGTFEAAWPLSNAPEFDESLAQLLDRYGSLSRRPPGEVPTNPLLDDKLRYLTRLVAEYTGRRDPRDTAAVIRAIVPTLDLVMHQSDAPQLSEQAFAVRTIASAYLTAVEDAGLDAHMFVLAMWDLTFCDFHWTDTGKHFVFPMEHGHRMHTAGGVSVNGFHYQRQLRQARELASACRTLLRGLHHLLT